MSAVLNFAVKFYGLRQNPARIAGSIGTLKSDRAKYWTLETFNSVIKQVQSIQARTAFIILFYSGLRIGELLALTLADYEQGTATLNVNKTLYKINGKGYTVTTPKTKKAIRKVKLPNRAAAVLDEYIQALYEPQPQQRIFFNSQAQLLIALNKAAALAGVEKIRLHDLRHSHASLLINNGVSVKAVSERLGHEDITTTLNIYSHLYAKQDNNIADMLDKLQ
ncbi:site-specific recombinase, phage integrase family, partial [gut metagenome]